MSEVKQAVTVAELQAEAARVDSTIEEAAVQDDAGEFLRLQMRKAALPALIRQAQAQLIRREIAELEEELRGLDEEMAAAQAAPPPEVPVKLRGQQTPQMLKTRRISGVSTRSLVVSKELRELRLSLAELEGGGAGSSDSSKR